MSYIQRTELNVRDSDGTVIFSMGETLRGGSRKTVKLARKPGKPVIHLSKAGVVAVAAALQSFITEHGIGGAQRRRAKSLEGT